MVLVSGALPFTKQPTIPCAISSFFCASSDDKRSKADPPDEVSLQAVFVGVHKWSLSRGKASNMLTCRREFSSDLHRPR